MLLLPGKAGGETLPRTQLGLFVCQSGWLTPQQGRHPVALFYFFFFFALFCFSQLKKLGKKKIIIITITINAGEREAERKEVKRASRA